jgi:parallel beta-helix repeat protein
MNVNKLISISLIFLFFGVTGNASGSDNCTTAPTSSLVVNVMDKGAKANGITDDTAAIQAAVNQVAGTGGTVLVPDGTYMIDAITGIQIKSDMTLRMSRDTILKALPNGKDNYNIINITGASNINVIDGTLIGERDEHSGTTGEWGMGILLRDAANIVIEGVMAKNCWGDGFYIRGASKNVKFCSVIADNNRRQGMSIISVNGMVVKNSIFKNTGGTPPQAGIDLEPNDEDTISNVQILNSQFSGNKGFGIQLYQGAKHSLIKNVTIDGNTISNNIAGGIANLNSSDHRISNNLVKDNQHYGIRLSKGAKGNTVTGNKVTGENGTRDEDGGNTVFDNSLDRNMNIIEKAFKKLSSRQG